MSKTRLLIYHEGREISNDVTLENGKRNPFGWSQCDVHHNGKHIGWIESGYAMDFVEGYTFKEIPLEQEQA